MTGYLYLITNIINGKKYIGKTYTSLSERWKAHLRDAYRIDRNKTKFQNAILKYGPEHFTMELLGEFEEGILEQKEIEYIAKYDSYHNGYNSTLGGDGTLSIQFSETDLNDIISKYDGGQSITKLAREYNVSIYSIKKIILRSNRYIQSADEVPVVRYSSTGEYIKIYDTIRDIVPDIVSEGYSADLRNLYRYIHEACTTGCIRYGSTWRLYSSLSKDEILLYCTLPDGDISIANTRKKRDASGVTCIELNLHFTTFKAAGQYLINNNIASGDAIYIGYRISKAKKQNKKCYNMHWK